MQYNIATEMSGLHQHAVPVLYLCSNFLYLVLPLLYLALPLLHLALPLLYLCSNWLYLCSTWLYLCSTWLYPALPGFLYLALPLLYSTSAPPGSTSALPLLYLALPLLYLCLPLFYFNGFRVLSRILSLGEMLLRIMLGGGLRPYRPQFVGGSEAMPPSARNFGLLRMVLRHSETVFEVIVWKWYAV